jgi:porphyrinogen peroxidase
VQEILADLPTHARYLTFHLRPGISAARVAATLAACEVPEGSVVGIGLPVISLLDGLIPGLRVFPAMTGVGVHMPSTGGALWCWLRGQDRGELLHQGRALTRQLDGVFELHDVCDGFQFAGGLDLTGYIDGTENPEGARAAQVALIAGKGAGLDGSSFVAVQKWQHDLSAFEAMPQAQQDATIGRRRSDHEELVEAPKSAHVKRTAQEDFEPEAFLLRRSMPWAEGQQEGLMFVCFINHFDSFEAIARRMLGLDDGIVDALFEFTQPVSGAYFWCPMVKAGRLDLRALAIP